MTALLAWLTAVAIGTAVVARAHFSADLSAFLPHSPSTTQQLLIDQLRSGLATRLVLVGIEGGNSQQRARTADAMVSALRGQAVFLSVEDGAAADRERDHAFIFKHRYLLSPGVGPASFAPDGLHAALSNSLDWMAQYGALGGEQMLEYDPTGETLRIADALDSGREPHREQGVWSSPDGRRALLLTELRAGGSDTDAQAKALELIRAAFARVAPAGAGLRLLLSGPAVFAVDARTAIRGEVERLSLLGSALIVLLLMLVYRSPRLLLLGLLPVVTGALAGVAAVALGCGVVYGITLGFGTTLIGESVDYSIYLFVQSRSGKATDDGQSPDRLWPTIGLGMLTSICGFASLLPSSFPGLVQLGIYSIAGLLAAAAVTRWLLPPWLPSGARLRDLAPLGARMAAARAALPRPAIAVLILSVAAAAFLYLQRGAIWNRDLAALSPVSPAAQRLDAELRRQLGAPDVSNLVIIDGPDRETVLERAEAAAPALDRLASSGLIGGYDSPARYLPSSRAQAARRASLPDAATLRQSIRTASQGLGLRPESLEPFVDAVEAARAAPAIDRAALAGTSLALASDALLWRTDGQWHALLPLRSPTGTVDAQIDIGRVRTELAALPAGSVHALNLRQQTDALYGGYLHEAIRLSSWGCAAIAALLGAVLRSAHRVARVLLPLLASVLVVSAGLVAIGTRLNILHLIGLLLIVAVGSNYALFFDRRAQRRDGLLPLTLASLLIANATAVIGFGVLAFSSLPVLRALGSTVAPGALLALWFAAALTPREAFIPEAPR